MKLQFLGTAAGDGIPAPFCSCELCQKTRQLKGRNIRTRTCAVVDDAILIDFSPDIAAQCVRHDVTVFDKKAIFFTHAHIDHLAASELCLRYHWYCNLGDDQPLRLYGNALCKAEIERAFAYDTGSPTHPFLQFTLLEAFVPVEMGDLELTPLPANHTKAEEAFVFLIRKGETHFLYGTDTAMLSEETLGYLQTVVLDGACLDCTYGLYQHTGNTHMGFGANLELRQKLRQQGTWVDKTQGYCVHFSHKCNMLHDTLSQALAKEGLTATYDGMTITL